MKASREQTIKGYPYGGPAAEIIQETLKERGLDLSSQHPGPGVTGAKETGGGQMFGLIVNQRPKVAILPVLVLIAAANPAIIFFANSETLVE